jgi:alpha-aminoadipate carrier protein LysW
VTDGGIHWPNIDFSQAAEAFIMAVVCPECDNPITVDADEVEEGEVVVCDECGMELEVVSVDPLELAPVDVIGYDDEDDTPAVEDEE